jgi:hypothetical protein
MRNLNSILTTLSRLPRLIPLAVNYIYFKGVGPISVTARHKAWFFCGSSLAGNAGSNLCRECCVLSGRGLCDGSITLPEESYRVWCLSVIKCNSNL